MEIPSFDVPSCDGGCWKTLDDKMPHLFPISSKFRKVGACGCCQDADMHGEWFLVMGNGPYQAFLPFHPFCAVHLLNRADIPAMTAFAFSLDVVCLGR